jgi:hypothetical protein
MRIIPGGALEGEQEGPSSIFVGNKLVKHVGAFLLEYPCYVVDQVGFNGKKWDESTLIF